MGVHDVMLKDEMHNSHSLSGLSDPFALNSLPMKHCPVGVCVQVPAPLQTSFVHAKLSSLQVTPLGFFVQPAGFASESQTSQSFNGLSVSFARSAPSA
jgi:hypothetical protein